MRRRKTLRVLRKLTLGLLASVVAIVGVYVAYVFMTYHRLPDTYEQHSSRTENTVRPGEDYQIVTWNLGFGAHSRDFSFFMDGGEEARARSRQHVYDNVVHCLGVVVDEAPDFALFQEVDRKADRSWRVDLAEVLREAMKDYQSYYAQNSNSAYLLYPLKQPYGAVKSGILTFANRDIFRSERYSLPVETDWHKLLDLDRCYSLCRVPVSNGYQLCVYNLHLSPFTEDETIAAEQLKSMLQNMKDEYDRGNYVVAGGTFNRDLLGHSDEIFGVSGDYAWARPIDLDLFPEGLRLVDSLDPEHPVPSRRSCETGYVPGQTFAATVDGFIASDNVEALSCRVIDDGFLCSDHNPVALEFALKEAAFPAPTPSPAPEIETTEEPTP